MKTLADFIARAKSSDKPLTYSSSGVGSMGHLVAELFARKANLKFELIPYKGASQGLTDLVGGHIAFSCQTVSSTTAQLKAGTLLGLAQTGKTRMADYPSSADLHRARLSGRRQHGVVLAVGAGGLAGRHRRRRSTARSCAP